MPDIIAGLGASSAVSATTTPALLLSHSTVNRAGVLLVNTDATKRLFVVMSADFTNAPTINSTTYHYAVSPGTGQNIPVSSSIAVWVASESGTIATNAVEVQY